jgi:glycosyltransferase involved in cell wall biosynthesis/O-antigen/teichoic acid export membrane protein
MTGPRDKIAGLAALGVSGLAAYGFLAIAAHALGAARFAPIGALWAVVFLTGASLGTPLETELARRIGAARGRGVSYADDVRAGFALAITAGAIAVVLALALGSQLDSVLFGGQAGFSVAGAIAFAGLIVGAAVRGTYAGAGRMTMWGTYLLADGGSRFLVGLVVAALLPTDGAFAAAVAIGPWFAAVLAAAPVRAVARGARGRLRDGVRSVARTSSTLVVGASAASLLTYFGAVLLPAIVRGPDPHVGSYIAALTVARLPLFLFSPLVAISVPRIAFAREHGADRAATFEATLTVGVAVLMGIGVVLGGMIAGQEALKMLFGHDFVVSAGSLLALSIASASWLIATAAAATAVAAGRAGLVAAAWCLAAVVAAVVALVPGGDPFARTDLAITAGACTAALATVGTAIMAFRSPAGRPTQATRVVEAGPAAALSAAATAASPPRLRIRYVYDALYPEMNGGAERRYHELATRLAATCDVDYVTWTFGGGDPVHRRDGVTYRGVGPAPEFYGPDGKRRVGEAVAFAWRLVPALLRDRVDVLDVSATPTIPLYGAWLAAKLTRTPLVVTWHEFWGEHWHTYLPGARVVATVARLLESVSRRLGDRLVAVSAFTGSRLGAGPWASRVTVVGNGVAVDEIAAVAPSAERIDLLYLGRLIDEKRVELLLEAVAILARTDAAIRCVVIGEGPERSRLEALSTTLAIRENVRFAGRMPAADVHAALRAASILVLPSAREGYGIVVVEAQAAGAIPIVTTGPATAAPTLVRDGIDGLVVDPTPEAIAAAAVSLLGNPVRRAAMHAAAAESARAASWDAVASEMLGVYRALAAKPAATVAVTPMTQPLGQPS